MEQQDYNLEQLIESAFDFSIYSDEEKKDVIAETSGMIMEAGLLRALADAGEEAQESFNSFIESEPDDAAMADYISTSIPGFQSAIIQEIKVFQEMLKKNRPDTPQAETSE